MKPPQVQVIKSLTEVDLSGQEGVYLFQDLTAKVQDDYVNDVRLIDLDSTRVTAEVLLENRSGRNWTPRLTLRFVNRYGVVLGQHHILWLVDSLENNKRYTESIEFARYGFDEIFKFTELTRQPDFDQPKYLVIEYVR